MNPIAIPASYNYIAAFLTFDCNLKCSYCINRFGALVKRNEISGVEWINFLNRIESRDDLPITLQGGEPSLHRDFYKIINGIKPELNIDLLTNLRFDLTTFKRNVKPERLKRSSKYASIRVSYHPEQMRIDNLATKVLTFLDAGYSIGIWAVLHPDRIDEIKIAQEYCSARGIDFRTKEFLGYHKGKLYGEYKYKDALDSELHDVMQCKTSELLIGPEGSIYRCHSDLYFGASEIMNNSINDEKIIMDKYLECGTYGRCNPCDVKTKTNRFQEYGHTSVKIKGAK